MGFNRKRVTLRVDMAALSTDKVTNFVYAPWTPLEAGLTIQGFASCIQVLGIFGSLIR